MMYFLVSCFSIILLFPTFFKPLPKSKMRAFPLFLWAGIHRSFKSLGRKGRIFTHFFQVSSVYPSIRRKMSTPTEEKKEISLLDLPDLALDCILERLSPAELCGMTRVCSYLKERGKSDHLWERHMKQKWGGVIGNAAYRDWICCLASEREPKFLNCPARKGKSQYFSSGFLGFFGCNYEIEERESYSINTLPVDSIMSCYIALETGKLWFPAQVYNREVQNGHAGFLLSCYDAKLSYDSKTDNFVARYPAYGSIMIEDNIEWNRIRAAAVDTPSNELQISDCLHDLRPDDHVEIQWRRSKEFPHGWWYGVVGHLESCNANELNCQCHISDDVILEFKQYRVGCRWRKMAINREDHREVGNEADGLYGGIGKLYKKEEIAKWIHLWGSCSPE